MEVAQQLVKHVDSIVLLGSMRTCPWVLEALEPLAVAVPVYHVTATHSLETLRCSPPGHRGVRRLDVSVIPSRGRVELIFEALLAEGAIRPLFVMEGADFEEVLTASRAPLRVAVFAEGTLRELAFPFLAGELEATRARFQQHQALKQASNHAGAGALAEAFEAFPRRMRLLRTLRACDVVLTSSEERATQLRACAGFPVEVEQANAASLCASLLCRLQGRSADPSPGRAGTAAPSRLNIAYLYDHHSTHVGTIVEYLESFGLYSRHRIHYVAATNEAVAELDLSGFDVLLVHYSVRLYPHELWIAASYQRAMQRFGGYKALFIQDEYDITDNARRRIRELGFHTVFTCVPEPYIEAVYPKAMFPRTHFVNVLTGYVSKQLEQGLQVPAMRERTTVIGYRGRALPFYYGDLGQEKINIGRRMRAACEQRGIPVDIEWDEQHRVYADGWLHFLMGCKATLGTESGSNLFDDTGSLREAVAAELAANPEVTYQEVAERHFRGLEGRVRMNQISPKIFESIALRTALVLFEGSYSGVIRPDEHYISLKKDFSNIDEVLARLADDSFLTALTERAYQEVVASGRYSYARFVQMIDAHLDAEVPRGGYLHPQSAVISWRDPLDASVQPFPAAAAVRYPTDHLSSYSLARWDQPLYLDPAGSVAHDVLLAERPRPPVEKESWATWLRQLRGAAWVDAHILKPFNRVWEYHRKRLKKRRQSRR